ncbi:MAG: hypothetical protein QXU40_00945 [Candidatus Pacearchaeota archaeon]
MDDKKETKEGPDRFLVFLLILSIAISILGLGYNLYRVEKLKTTGLATTGIVNLTLESVVELNVTVTNCYFGSGRLEPDKVSALLDCNGTKINWTNTTIFNASQIIVENTGNKNITVNLSSDKNAAGFIGGTSPSFKFTSRDTDGSKDSCVQGEVPYPGTEIAANTQYVACSILRFLDNYDRLNVSATLLIPEDAPTGYKVATWTFTAWNGSS